MKISGIFNERSPVFSCEVFPPKPDNDIETVYNTLSDIAEINPDFVSVTYGAGGTTRERTLEIAKNIKL